MKKINVEVCTGSLQDVITACRFPIARIELNTALELGGLTPSAGLFLKVKEICPVPVMCMVRPRGSGFCYSETEYEQMLRDAQWLLEHCAGGIVFGFLNEKDSVDTERTRKMADLIHSFGKTAVFHKAFDLARGADTALEDLISCHVDRILTSGHKDTALEGTNTLKHLLETADGKTEILPGGGIRSGNVLQILTETGTKQIHLSASVRLQDHGSYQAVSAAELNALFSVLNTYSHENSEERELTGADIEMLREDRFEEGFQSSEDEER